ncbi:alpha/beta hydrolase [Nocardia cyriacigeorgica]|uniref:Putative esterase n=1 Tax=Nocardia cyriacigeorgica (strain GUH-2) TaxID=1127134 RepID=H6R149_NOCCG|nr:alpha/beta hydrolase family protein [Nocardia cyriacigeorgica]CCF63021.1 putative esterase [Nocardia cyriacigeorgica GUH-2]
MSIGSSRIRWRAMSVLMPLTVVAALCTVAEPAVASGTPEAPIPAGTQSAPDGSRIVAINRGADEFLDMRVHSTAMDTEITVKVRPAPSDSEPAPVLYLLNGADGGADRNWTNATDIADFFADEQVTLVVPMGGRGSYFADWRADDPVLGKQRWTTFLTEELPPIIDSAFDSTGKNAIAGISMAGTAVFQLALAAPKLYQAIGSYSGCVQTSDLSGRALITAVVASNGGNPANMWGASREVWAAKDPYLHAGELRDTAIYVSTGTGLPGPLDNLPSAGDPLALAYQLVFGAPLEQVTNVCTHRLRDRFEELSIPATFDFRDTGTHSWGYWEQDLHRSWELFRAALAE